MCVTKTVQAQCVLQPDSSECVSGGSVGIFDALYAQNGTYNLLDIIRKNLCHPVNIPSLFRLQVRSLCNLILLA